jgi:hypothetical protein
MVQALLNTKPNTWPAEPIDPSESFEWQTRRVIKPRYRPGDIGFKVSRGLSGTAISIIDDEEATIREESPKYWPGDIIWARETWAGDGKTEDSAWMYKASTNDDPYGGKWHPSIFMPRKAARLFLEVKGVRIERVQDITEEDARAEGVDGGCLTCGESEPCGCNNPCPDCRDAFIWLWNHLNSKRGYPWDSNPYVYVYEFMRVK